MRLHVLAPLFSTTFVACVPAEETPADPRDLTINWNFKDLDGKPVGCPAGFSVMNIWITNNDYDGYWQKVFDVPCSAGTHTETVFTAGREQTEDGGWWTHGKIHDVRLKVTEPTGQSVAAGAPYLAEGTPPPPGRFITLDQDRAIDFDIYAGGGFGVARWHLTSKNTGSDLISCAAAGVDTVRFTYFVGYYPGDTTPIVTEWPCDAKDIDFEPDATEYELGSGRTRVVAPETYYGIFEALRNGVVVGTRGGDGDAIGFDSSPGNRAFHITNANITINDR